MWAGSIPSVSGLNLRGESVYTSGLGEIDYTPSAGEPWPSRVSLAPGESLYYSFTEKDMSSTALAEIRYWHTETDSVWVDYAEFDLHVRCGTVDVIPPSQGKSIPNTFS
ncbi:hypothetical protein Arth_0981 [Arthrobacter sp. FB24]|nr:hypothetical protein Arth_0981 [Arthrobacter sp. FB24]